MTRQWLDEALSATGLRGGQCFPRNLVLDLMMSLPMTVILLPAATTNAVRRWLADRGIEHEVSPGNRRLHGCLVAVGGKAIVFLDSDDDDKEQRFTLAHEIAHFILDHLVPRLRATTAFGERIRPVLDGEREPTQEEMLSAVFERVPLGMHVHLMARGAHGEVCNWSVEESEQRADRLALELIAPSQCATASLRDVLDEPDNSQDLALQRDQAAHHLSERFGLPLHAAASYADLLLAKETERPRLSEELFGKH